MKFDAPIFSFFCFHRNGCNQIGVGASTPYSSKRKRTVPYLDIFRNTLRQLLYDQSKDAKRVWRPSRLRSLSG